MSRRERGSGGSGRTEHPAAQATRTRAFVAGIEPFTLFCAYHLGLFPDGSVRFANVHDVARAFETDTDTVQRALEAYGLSPDVVVNGTFDVASAQADVAVSPPGVDLVALASMHWDMLLSSWGEKRDWNAELIRDEAENARVYGDEIDRERDT
jgi:hypothetical protein